MINAVLAFIDFFAASIQVRNNHIRNWEFSAFANLMRTSMVQRVAVSAVANACKKVPSDCSQFVLDAVPTLCNLLQSEDKVVLLSPHLIEIILSCKECSASGCNRYQYPDSREGCSLPGKHCGLL